ncbi:acyltransferase family protein [Salisediminibacterium selenitireducens]|uniref:acyltransferase family protein n=1 Tax=Salisediminibacterium selenitireducens TaxID=85683 RepID=UPI00015F959F|nr:acyltransferase family protein [Salisediminibacterium selenitireducens]
MMMLTVGMLFPVERAFPGFAALFPVAGAALILIASNQGGRAGVGRIVGSRPLVWFGHYAYAFYLWHWPLLVFYLVRVRPEHVPLSDGVLLIAASAILAVVTTEWLETPLRNLAQKKRPLVRTMMASVFTLPLVAVLFFWQLDMQSPLEERSVDNMNAAPVDENEPDNENHEEEEESAFPYVVEDPRYPGAMGLFDEVPVPEVPDIIPPAVDARESLPPVYDDGCHQNQTSEEVIACTYGYEGDDPAYTIAGVGGSHSAHWLPPLMAISEDEQILIRSYTKSNCRFTTDDLDELSEGCLPWGETLLDILIEDPPDLVFTTSTAQEGREIPGGFLEKWASLNDHGIQVFAIRDVPWMAFDVAACVSEEEDTSNCITPADEVLYAGDPWEDLQDQPTNVTYADLNPFVCPEGACLPVIGNILVYRDSNHITKEYAISMRPLLEERIIPLLEGE